MSAESEPLALAGDFPETTRDEWRSLVAAVLRKSGAPEGVDPETALSSRTYDGIVLKPLYTAADVPTDRGQGVDADGLPGLPPFTRGATADGAAATGWDVRAQHTDPDAKRTNAAILTDLANGATSIWMRVGDGGLAIEDLDAALDGVYLDLAPVVLDAGADTAAAASVLLALGDQRSVARAELSGSFGADPIGLRARTGAPADLAGLLALSGQRKGTALRVATVDATVYHEAGASDAEEIAIATAVGLEYLRALTDGGLAVDEALALLDFRFAVTAEQFPSIAKLRAARRVWDRVGELSGAADERRGQWQHAVTSAAMLTQRDPWVNMLRTTIACFAAAVGGAQAITVLPFDNAIGLPDDFARRIARNTQSVLHDESSLARVIDPGGGSWFIESLTDALAEAAWERFTAIERAGGALAALDDGAIPAMVSATRDKRAEDIAHRRAPITGVSEYALLTEAPVVREAAAPTTGGGFLAPHRYASDFEALRDRCDAAPERPRIFLATLGSPNNPRVGFAANLFQAAGIECISEPAEHYVNFAAIPVVCICGTDKAYADGDAATTAAMALRAIGARYIWLAGTAAVDGVDDIVSRGSDALAVLRTTLDQLGVPA